jgi:hypothetical protein
MNDPSMIAVEENTCASMICIATLVVDASRIEDVLLFILWFQIQSVYF